MVGGASQPSNVGIVVVVVGIVVIVVIVVVIVVIAVVVIDRRQNDEIKSLKVSPQTFVTFS